MDTRHARGGAARGPYFFLYKNGVLHRTIECAKGGGEEEEEEERRRCKSTPYTTTDSLVKQSHKSKCY